MVQNTGEPVPRVRARMLGAPPDPIDLHVGLRLKTRRIMLGISQQLLAQRLGISFQQVQKYERGSNRLAASTLYRAAGILDVEVGWFFEEMGNNTTLPVLPVAENSQSHRLLLETARHLFKLTADQLHIINNIARAFNQQHP